MSFENEKVKFGREHIYIVEIDLGYCANTFGSAPCTATGSGDAKCYNTYASCQDQANYSLTTKTLRFYTPRSPAPIGISDGLDVAAIPCLNSVSTSPSVTDVSGGLGVRATVSASFNDFPHSDIGLDKYLADRTFIASEKGSFWTKLRARNPNYENRPIRVLSGYLVDGVFDIANFETRYYILDTMTVTGGQANIKGKDTLKLAMGKKAQVPAPSTGKLSAAITTGSTGLILTPSGVGNSEYPASGKIMIDREVMSFTRVADSMNLTRAQNNTVAAAHSQNATVQLCYEQTAQLVHTIVNDLLTNYAQVDSSFIPLSSWESEVQSFVNTALTGIITKPTDVNKVLKELSESAPHFLWWNEREQQIELTALKAPQAGQLLDMDANILEGSFSTTDKPDMRVSTVYVNFGQFDPTKKLDEPNNFEGSYVRVNTDALATYDNVEQIKVINSRWIPLTSEASTRRLAALIGRRFQDTPREINFNLDAKDSNVWTGQTVNIEHRDITDFAGDPDEVTYQILSASEGETYKYKALEFNYGEDLPEDEGGGDPTVDIVFIPDDAQNVNLRTLWDNEYPTSTNTSAKFILDTNRTCGSSSSTAYAIDTGTFAGGFTIELSINSGAKVIGKGGDGSTTTAAAGENGSPCLRVRHNLNITNNGIIGGGGGGGGAAQTVGNTGILRADGAGGAGYDVGTGGTNSYDGGGTVTINTPAQDGTDTTGGNRGIIRVNDSGLFSALSGVGGDLGQAGGTADSAGGAAGAAIVEDGGTVTYLLKGDIRGTAPA